MDQQPEKNRLDEAKRAMGGKINSQKRTASVDLSEDKLNQARQAMFSEDQINKEALKKEELEKKREEARRQMEGYNRRHQREVREYRESEVEKVKEQLERLKKEQGDPIEEEAKRKINIEKVKEVEKKAYDEKLSTSQAIIEKLKKEDSTNIKSYHTLTTDISEVIKKDKLSMAGIALQSEEKMRKTSPEQKNKNRLVVGLVLILLIVGSASSLVVWFLAKDFNNTSYQESYSSLISVENLITIDATDKHAAALRQEVASLLNNQQKNPRSITEIIFEETIVVDEAKEKIYFNSTDYLRRLQIKAGQGFTLALKPKFMTGLYTEDDLSASPFYIFTINSYELAFDSLLKQEGKIVSELIGLFGVNTSLIEEEKFTDEFINNINVRTAEINPDTKSRVFYTFPNRNTLIVTGSQKALLELIEAVRLLNITQ